MLPLWPAHCRKETAPEQQKYHSDEQRPLEDSNCHAVSARLVKIESKKRGVGKGNAVCTQRRLVLTPTMSVRKPELRCQYEPKRTSVKQLMQNHFAQISKSKSLTRWRHHEGTGDCAPQADSNSAMAGSDAVPMPQDITVKSDDINDSVPKHPVHPTNVTTACDDGDLSRRSIVFDLVWRECNGNHKCMRGKALAMALSRHSDGKGADTIVMGCPGGTTSRDHTITCLEADKMGSLVAAGSVDGRVAVYDLDEAGYLAMTQRNNKIKEYEESPLMIQRAIREFQTGRSVACVAWNPHRGRECELAVGFSYWADVHIYNLEGILPPPPYRILSPRRRPSVALMPLLNAESRREENSGRRCMIFFHPTSGNLKPEMLVAGGMEGAIDLWKGRSNNLQPAMSVPRESHRASEGSVIGLAELGGDKTMLLAAMSRGILNLYDISHSTNTAMTTYTSLMRVGKWDLKHHSVWPGGTPSCLASLRVSGLQILGGPRVPFNKSKTEGGPQMHCSGVLVSLMNGAMLVFDMYRKRVHSAWIPEVPQIEKPEKHHAVQAVVFHGEVHVISTISRRCIACMDLALFKSGSKHQMETCEWASKPCTWRKISPITTSMTAEKSADISCLAGCPHTGSVFAGMADGTVRVLV